MIGPATQEFDTLCFEGLDAILQPADVPTIDRKPVLMPGGPGTEYRIKRLGQVVSSLLPPLDVQIDSVEQETADSTAVYSAA